ncbi:MAG: EAL domain-containing protein [Anaerolineaceae bacterium]|nr:MAG: EAL domain-containing protein [Anaerolineaceae bacterium]
MSIKKSLRIIMIISSIIPVVIVSVIAQGLLSHRLLQVQKSNLIKAAELNRSGLEAMIETHKTEISMLSLDSDLITLVNENDSLDPSLINIVNQILHDRKEVNPFCRALTLYDKDRFAIASSDEQNIGNDGRLNLTLSYLFATKKSAVGVSGLLDGTIEIGYPILVNGGNNPPVGYIVSTLHLSYFENFLDAITYGDTGHAVLLDHGGDILYHPDESLMGTRISSTRLRNIVSDYNKGQVQPSGTFEHYHNNTNQIYGYSIIPEMGWALLVKQDVSEIWSMTSLILTLLIFICAVLLVFIIIFAHFLSRRYTEPIIQLRDAMRTASDGDLSVQSYIKSKNELGELSKNFNKMLHIIKTNYEDLESMHEELLSNEEQLRNNYDHIEYLAYHDTLTNLPNKLAFLDYVNASLISSPGSNKSHAVYFVDLDNFKTVNDTLGHEYGDSLLIHTANILTALGENGMLARAGGDEFLIFRENIDSMDEAIDYASSIIDRFKEPIDLEGEDIYLSMSIGIAIYPDNGLSPNALIKNADIAMYKSKDTGKNKYTLFDSKMEDELNRNTNIVEVLRGAIENKDIYLQYQPQYDLATNSVLGFEALMRIRSDQLGFITPEEFIPVAEESGLIIELSAWLIREACRFNKKLIDYGITPRHVSVNISSIQINRPGFVDFLSGILEETGLSPEYLVLEITESTLVSSIMDATELLHNLQDLGVKISLDDFGTGYSSLNYLTNMPINTLKIDKSFIDNICSSKKDARIAESIIALAHSLKIKVVAEGVETKEQLELLREKNCDIIQGFVFSGPLHPQELEDLVKHE